MWVSTFWFDKERGWSVDAFPKVESENSFLLLFCAPALIDSDQPFEDLKAAYPNTIKIGCTGAGEIHELEIHDDRLIVTLVQFNSTRVKHASAKFSSAEESYEAAKKIALELADPKLRSVVVFSDGLLVNGSEVARAFRDVLPSDVVVTGGLAGDDAKFQRTVVIADELRASGLITAVGLSGDHLAVSSYCKAGWNPFGMERTITRSQGNVVYEIDGIPALQLYKEYLGEKAKDLPGSGMFFPLAIRRHESDEHYLLRLALKVDEDEQSLTFGGDVPQGNVAHLMYANLQLIINASGEVGANAARALAGKTPQLGVAVSCIARREVLRDRTEEELEAVSTKLGSNCPVVGFYSYGELAPGSEENCDLWNQTMTLVVYSEAA